MYGIIKNISFRLFRLSVLIAGVVVFLSGCSDEFSRVTDETSTTTEAKLILKRASEVRADPAVTNPLPRAYRRAPEILKTSKGWKVFYYTRNHSPKVVSELMKGQIKNSFSVSDETNQLIINCADQKDVDQVLSYLESVDVEPIQVKIDCIIVEHYADVTMDRETQVKVNELFGEKLVLEGDVKGFDNQTGWGIFPGASIREQQRSDFGMSIGYDSDEIKFLIDMLVSRGYLKVLMNPSVETVNGGTAYIMSKDQVPTVKIVNDKKNQPYSLTEYIWIEDSLKVVPEVFADGSVSLSAEVVLSSKNTPEGVVQLPIITERKINLGQSRLTPGQSLVVGGFRKSEQSSVMRGFPFLKDIPLLGMIFSSRDFEERAKEVTFILTPTISSGGISYGDMLEKVAQERTLHTDPNDIGATIKEVLMDPFGTQAHTRQLEIQREAETIKRLRIEIETAETEVEAELAREKLEEYQMKIRSEEQASKRALAQTQENQKKIAELEKLSSQLKEDIAKQKAEFEKTIEKTQSAADLTAKEIMQITADAEKSQQKIEQQQKKLQEIDKNKAQIEQKKAELIKRQELLKKEIAQLEKLAAEASAPIESKPEAQKKPEDKPETKQEAKEKPKEEPAKSEDKSQQTDEKEQNNEG